VFRIVVSSDSMKNATATSHGRSRLLDAEGVCEEAFTQIRSALQAAIVWLGSQVATQIAETPDD
jgi:hypothetical protein